MLLVRIVGLALFLAAIGCAIACSSVISDMIGDINRKLPSDAQENPLLGYPGKVGRIRRKYRQLYPEGSRIHSLNRLTIICCALFIVGVGLILGPGFCK
jgi:hypothetical protein